MTRQFEVSISATLTGPASEDEGMERRIAVEALEHALFHLHVFGVITEDWAFSVNREEPGDAPAGDQAQGQVHPGQAEGH